MGQNKYVACQLVARTVHPLLVQIANNLLVCSTVSRWCHVASSYYFLRSCALRRRWRSECTLDSFVSWFSSFDCWMPIIIPRRVCLVCRQNAVQSDASFPKLQKIIQRSPLIHFSVSCEKWCGPGNVGTDSALIRLIDETRRNTNTIAFFLCVFFRVKASCAHNCTS